MARGRDQVAHDDEAFLPGTAAASYGSPRSSRSKRVAPNRAAEVCFNTVRELFRFALLVPQHTDQVSSQCCRRKRLVFCMTSHTLSIVLQVVLILQRTVEEFATAVKSRRKERTSELVSQDVFTRMQNSSSAGVALSGDMYHRRYCKRVFDGKSSALELLGVSSQIRAAAHDMFPEHVTDSDEEDERQSMAQERSGRHSSSSLRAVLVASRPYLPVSRFNLYLNAAQLADLL